MTAWQAVSKAGTGRAGSPAEARMGTSGRRGDDGSEGTGTETPQDIPDTVLVREAKAGNSEAFGHLIRRYQDKIYTIVFSQLSSREDALDLSQEVFLKAHRRLPDFREDC